ncbi:MAG: hypothetical protein Q9220_007703 [cf. Caloplaca sp. 1 TL-2023]
MFVLDSQYSHLFQQQPSYTGLLAKDGLDLPFPTSTEIWDCTDIPTWRDLIILQQTFSLSALPLNQLPLDPFQSSLLTCYQIHYIRRSDRSSSSDEPSSSSGQQQQHELIYHPAKSHLLPLTLAHHAYSLALHTPLHALLITASESWLFGTKITDEAVWQASKAKVKKWVGGEEALRAVWHAVQLSRLAFQDLLSPQGQALLQQQQVDGGAAAAAAVAGAGYLHDHWCLYVAALVCWAFGYSKTQPQQANKKQQRFTTEREAEIAAAEYLNAMHVADWRDLGDVGIRKEDTRGLLECVRVRVGDVVGMGGLLDGAEDVLWRLLRGAGGEMVGF